MAKNETILVADGNDDDVVLLRTAFQEVGLKQPPVVVRSGAEAMRYLAGENEYADRAAHPAPRLFLLDLKLPQRDGFEVLAWLQGHPEIARSLTVIVFTSLELDQPMAKAYALGAHSYLFKPVNYSGLVELIRRVKEYWIDSNRRPGVG